MSIDTNTTQDPATPSRVRPASRAGSTSARHRRLVGHRSRSRPVLILVVFPGATESVITGAVLLAFGLGWAMIARPVQRA